LLLQLQNERCAGNLTTAVCWQFCKHSAGNLQLQQLLTATNLQLTAQPGATELLSELCWRICSVFCATPPVVPITAHHGLLTNQPFLVWPVLVVRGSGLCVVQY
jgi:hypothetical protein